MSRRSRDRRQAAALAGTLASITPDTSSRPGAVIRSPWLVETDETGGSLLPGPERRWYAPWRREATGTAYETSEDRGRAQLVAMATGTDLAVFEAAPNGGIPTSIMEAVGSAASTRNAAVAPTRSGFMADVPRGGATERNQGMTQVGGAADRRTLLQQFEMAYRSCSTASACVDVTARTCSAGAMDVVADDETNEDLHKSTPTPIVQKALDLFSYVNPRQNFRQMMRQIFTDLQIYGDSFVEVVWLFGEPIALYNLPAADMIELADEHGVTEGYVQLTDNNQRAPFDPHQVIHIKFDTPRGGLYGLGPTEKVIHSITTWMHTEGLVKAIMRKGNPIRAAYSFDRNLPPERIEAWIQEYRAKNLGPDNYGNPIVLLGDGTIKEFQGQMLAELLAVLDGQRDQICTGYGVPPAKLDIIESGNLGGGTGTSQDKTFKVNTCGPLQELVLEAFTFAILKQGFGIDGYRCKFEEMDWRDDETIEKIRTQRVERGGWSPNRYRDEIGEPAVDGGDDPVFVLSRDVVPIKDIAAKSAATIAPVAEIGADSGSTAAGGSGGSRALPGGGPTPPSGGAASQGPRHAKGQPTPTNESELFEAFEVVLRERASAVRSKS